MKNISLSLASFLFSASAFGALLTPEGTAQKIEKITISPMATATIENEKTIFSSAGTGLRSKKVVFLNIKVYVGQLYLTSAESFQRTENEALGSLKNQKAVAFQLHFVRDVDAENIQKSFKEALKSNKIDLEDTSIKQFLDLVAKGGESKEGKTITILGARLKDGNEVIFYETNNGAISEVKGSTGLIEKIFSIWLGTPADEGISDLKKSILKK